MDLEQAFNGGQAGGQDRIGRILALTERLKKIRDAADLIRFDEQLSLEVPDALKALGNAKAAAIAELKTV
jgi:hypothetical protein